MDTATGEGKKTPVFDHNRSGGRRVDDDLGDREFVLEDEVVLAAEEHFGYVAINDTTGIGCHLGVLRDRSSDSRVEGIEVFAKHVVNTEVTRIAAGAGRVGVVVVGVVHICSGLIL